MSETTEAELLSRLVPAVRMIETGQVFPGRRGELHIDIAETHVPDFDRPYSHGNVWSRGFWDPVECRWYRGFDIYSDRTRTYEQIFQDLEK
jgi:hypothetical protein